MIPTSAIAIMNANIEALKSMAMYYWSVYDKHATKQITFSIKTTKVNAEMKPLFRLGFSEWPAEHMESHVIILRVVGNGCIFQQ